MKSKKVSKTPYLGCNKHDKTQFIFLKWNMGYEAQRQREKLHKQDFLDHC